MLCGVSPNTHHPHLSPPLVAFFSAALSRGRESQIAAELIRPQKPYVFVLIHLSQRTNAPAQSSRRVFELFLFSKILYRSAISEAHVNNISTNFEEEAEIEF